MSFKHSAISGVGLFSFLLVLLAVSCKKHNTAGPPRITTISPMDGPGGTMVTIKGSGFSATPDLESVYFNGKGAVITFVADSILLATVPPLAGTGIVSVKINGTTTTGPSFTYDYRGLVTTYAGTPGLSGSNNGDRKSATFNAPENLTADAGGNLYIADTYNNMIRRITPDGRVSTLVNAPDNPYGVALDGKGNLDVSLYAVILQLSLSTVKITTLCGTNFPGYANSAIGTHASFENLKGLTVGKNGHLYAADAGNQVIRLVSAVIPAGATATFAGIPSTTGSNNSSAHASTFNNPTDIVFDIAGNAYVADAYNNQIRKITPGGTVSTLAGNGNPGFADGKGGAAGFDSPAAITIDSKGNLYVTDENNNAIRMITPAGVVTTIAGSGDVGSADGLGAAASFRAPQGITCDARDILWVSDTQNNTIRKIIVQ